MFVTAATKCALRGGVSRIGRQRQEKRWFSEVTDRITFLIMGPPGGGKGTIAERLVKDFKFKHMSSGDMLRAQVDKKTKLGEEASRFMSKGELVPDELMVKLVLAELVGSDSGKVLLDGFPRTVFQANALESAVPINCALNLEVPDEEIVERISDRWVHLDSGRVYSYGFHPPKDNGKDDVTGEPLIRRPDDEPEKIRTRLKIYHEQTSPLAQHYESNGTLVSFDGSDYPDLVAKNRRSDAIYSSMKPYVTTQLQAIEE